MNRFQQVKSVVFPVIVAGLGFVLFAGLLATGPSLDSKAPAPVIPLVQSLEVALGPIQMTAMTYGTIAPRSETSLVSEVSGRIIKISPNMVSGGFFEAGELLFEVDPVDYQIALDQANANLNRARGELAFAEKDYKRQLDLKQRQSISQAIEDDALKRLQIARAVHQDARSKTAAAQRDLSRTSVIAPYQGRVRNENIDLGQYVSRGVALANLYATDFAEVRLPLQDEELAYLDVSLANESKGAEGQAQVNLTANFAGQPQRWLGEIVRSEGEIDAVSRMIHLVARVTAPYEPQSGQAPLAVGLFVEAEILGRTLENVVVLPRTAIRGEDQVFLIGQDQRLELKQVSVVRRLGDQVIVGGGLADGDLICLTAMDDAVPGMRVRIQDTESMVTLR